jgi:hypothetical protein
MRHALKLTVLGFTAAALLGVPASAHASNACFFTGYDSGNQPINVSTPGWNGDKETLDKASMNIGNSLASGHPSGYNLAQGTLTCGNQATTLSVIKYDDGTVSYSTDVGAASTINPEPIQATPIGYHEPWPVARPWVIVNGPVVYRRTYYPEYYGTRVVIGPSYYYRDHRRDHSRRVYRYHDGPYDRDDRHNRRDRHDGHRGHR